MKRLFPRKGFSLVELLVVIGIVGILSSTFLGIFGSVRKSSRDSRRIADLEQAEQALRLYYGKCGMYPGSFDAVTKECEGGQSGGSGLDPDSWGELSDILSKAEIGVTDIPNDPVIGKTYEYFVQRATGQTPRAQCYVLKAVLESDHAALSRDIDMEDIETKLLPEGGAVAVKGLFPDDIQCDDAGGERNYCKGNLECFYGS